MAFATARIVEGVLYILGVVSLLSLMATSEKYITAEPVDTIYYQKTAGLL